VAGGRPRFAAEAPWAWRLLRRWLRELPASVRTEVPGREPIVADARGAADLVLVHADPEAFLPPRSGERLLSALANDPSLALVLPVSNEAQVEEARRVPPFAYSTPSALLEAAASLASDAPPIRPCAAPKSPVYAVRRDALRALAADVPLAKAPERISAAGGRAAVDPGAYLHRYPAMDEQPREDLAARVPEGAAAVLEVGCARGAMAKALRARGVRRLVGIEPDPDNAASAAGAYDRVFAEPLESVREPFAEEFDAVIFGDVLEHLLDPAAALERVRAWLKPGGLVIASVPNVGHWSIVGDLARGRFDYVPYSLLSGTHVRFFTRSSLVALFEDCGYRVRGVDVVRLAVSPEGEEALARLRAWPDASADLDVAEFLIVAERDASRSSGSPAAPAISS
jgi:SAM-dependent methyltransferase